VSRTFPTKVATTMILAPAVTINTIAEVGALIGETVPSKLFAFTFFRNSINVEAILQLNLPLVVIRKNSIVRRIGEDEVVDYGKLCC
jgi:hypothetical protein